MNIDKQQAIRISCAIGGLVFHATADYRNGAADGFCDGCPGGREDHTWTYRNEGRVLKYQLDAVIEKLQRDGYDPIPHLEREVLGVLDKVEQIGPKPKTEEQLAQRVQELEAFVARLAEPFGCEGDPMNIELRARELMGKEVG